MLLALAVAAGARAEPLPPDVAREPPAAATAAAPVARIRTANHDGFGRVVIDLPPGVTASAGAETGGVLVRITGGTLAGAARAPLNVTAIDAEATEAHLALAPGATFTAVRLAAHLVIDVYAASAAKPGATPSAPVAPRTAAAAPPLPAKARRTAGLAVPPPRPVPAPPSAAVPPSGSATLNAAGSAEPVRMPLQRLLDGKIPAMLLPPAPAPAPSAAAPMARPGPAAAPVTAVHNAVLPAQGMGTGIMAGTEQANAMPAGGAGPLAIAAQADAATLVLPFAPGTGAAAFRRGAETVVVFDERRPLDLSTLGGSPAVASAFAGAQVQLLPAATVLRVTLPAGAGLRLAHGADGWALSRVAPSPALAPIHGDVVDGAMRLPATAPGAVVSVPDPETGGALLVGTQTEPGQGVPLTRRTPEFALLETLQGVAVDPAADTLALRVAPAKQFSGFVLESEAGPDSGPGVALDPLGPGALAAIDAARMTRRWDFPALPTAALLRRLQVATDAAAAAPPQDRAAGRLAAVQAMLAFGMGAEAGALANLTVTDDARLADQPDAAGLGAIAALLAGRTGEADAIGDPRLDGTDEVALWRAVRAAMLREGAPDAAAGFAATLPLLLAYPAALSERLLPLAAETMVLGGEADAARRLLAARASDTRLDFARALLAEHDNQDAAALGIDDRLARSEDRRERYRAAVRAAELRLRSGAFTPTQAADALDKLIYAWRGDRQELALRLRVADLREASGNWRAGLALLRETGEGDLGETWADQKPAIRARMGEMFAKALSGDANTALSPLELVSLIEENPDLLPEGEAGRALAARLADRLAALDLPRRAGPVLEKLMTATPTGAARAEVGARLAALRLRLKDPAGALEALSASTAADLPVEVDEARAITFARATAARGALGPAVATLAALGTSAADEARATLLEQARDWPGAVAALSSYAQKTVSPDGTLAEAPAQLLLRLASDAAQAGDEGLLGQLRDLDLPRMPAGKLADMFRMLTERPVQGVADLPRAAQEAALARGVPAALKAMPPPARQP
jgi:hypothetical protein